MPTVEPGSKRSVTCSSTFLRAPALYLNETSRSSTEPSDTSFAPAGLGSMAGSSRSTSHTRPTLVTARASSKNTLEIMLSEFMISST